MKTLTDSQLRIASTVKPIHYFNLYYAEDINFHKSSAPMVMGKILIFSLIFLIGQKILIFVWVSVCVTNSLSSAASPQIWCLQPRAICRWQSYHSQHSSPLQIYTQVKLFSPPLTKLSLLLVIFWIKVTRSLHSHPGKDSSLAGYFAII